MGDDNRKKLYDALSNDYDMGSFELFCDDIQDESKRKKLYDTIKEEYDLPDFGGFSRQLGVGEGSQPYGEKAQDVSDAQAASGVQNVSGGHGASDNTGYGSLDYGSSGRTGSVYGGMTGAQLMGASPSREAVRVNPVTGQVVGGGSLATQKPSGKVYPGEGNSLASTLNEESVAERKREEEEREREKEAQQREEEEQRALMKQYLSDSGQIDRIKQMRDEAQQRIDNNPDKVSWTDIALGMTNIYSGTQVALKELKNLFGKGDMAADRRIVKNADRALEMIDEAGHADKDFLDKQIGGVFRGLADSATDSDTWDFGLGGMSEGVALKRILDKREKGEELTPSEEGMLTMLGLNAYVQEVYGEDVGMGYNVGKSLPESAGFMTQMYLNPIGGLGKKAAEYVGKRALKNLAKKGVERGMRRALTKGAAGGARVLGDMVEQAGTTLIPGAGRVYEDYLNRSLGEAGYTIDEEGNVVYDGQHGQEEDNALAKAIGSNYIENWSEAVGEYFAPIGKGAKSLLKGATGKKAADAVTDAASDAAGRAAGRTAGEAADASRRASGAAGTGAGAPGASAAGEATNSLFDRIMGTSSKQIAKSMDDFRKKVKFDGLVGEYMEEVAGNVINAATVGDNNFSVDPDSKEWNNSVFNPEMNAETFLSCALMSGTMYAVETGAKYTGDRLEKRRVRRHIEERKGFWEGRCGELLGDNWRSVKEGLDSAEPGDLVDYVNNVNQSKTLSDDEKRALSNYAYYLMQMQAFNTRRAQDVEQMTPEERMAEAEDERESQAEDVAMSQSSLEEARASLDGLDRGLREQLEDLLGDDASDGEINAMLDGLDPDTSLSARGFIDAWKRSKRAEENSVELQQQKQQAAYEDARRQRRSVYRELQRARRNASVVLGEYSGLESLPPSAREDAVKALNSQQRSAAQRLFDAKDAAGALFDEFRQGVDKAGEQASAQAGADFDRLRNADSGRMMQVTVDGMDGPVWITSGSVVFDKEGHADTLQSDDMIIVMDGEGDVKMYSPMMITSVVSDVTREEYINSAVSQAESEAYDRLEAELESPDIPAPEKGGYFLGKDAKGNESRFLITEVNGDQVKGVKLNEDGTAIDEANPSEETVYLEEYYSRKEDELWPENEPYDGSAGGASGTEGAAQNGVAPGQVSVSDNGSGGSALSSVGGVNGASFGADGNAGLNAGGVSGADANQEADAEAYQEGVDYLSAIPKHQERGRDGKLREVYDWERAPVGSTRNGLMQVLGGDASKVDALIEQQVGRLEKERSQIDKMMSKLDESADLSNIVAIEEQRKALQEEKNDLDGRIGYWNQVRSAVRGAGTSEATDYDSLLERDPMAFYQAYGGEFGTEEANNVLASKRDAYYREAEKKATQATKETSPSKRAAILREAKELQRKGDALKNLVANWKNKPILPKKEEQSAQERREINIFAEAEEEARRQQEIVAGRTEEEQRAAQEAAQRRIDAEQAQREAGTGPVERKTRRFGEEEDRLGVTMSVREYVAREIATGRATFRWDDRGDTKGLGAHTANGEAERRRRIWSLNNKEGERPEVVAERIHEMLPDGMREQVTSMDVLDLVNELMTEYSSPSEMWDKEVRQPHAQMNHEELMPGYEEYDAQARMAWEAEKNGMSVEDWQSYNEYVEEQMRSLPAQEEIDNEITLNVNNYGDRRTEREVPAVDAGQGAQAAGVGLGTGERSNPQGAAFEREPAGAEAGLREGTPVVRQGAADAGGELQSRRLGSPELVGNEFSLSNKHADNGEQFYQDKNGNIDLVDIPQEVFDAIDYKKAPLRLIPSMISHMIGQHGKETGANDVDKAIGFILDVMNNFDHVRLGKNGALIFSIENGREKTGKRSISILLSSKTGDFYGIVSSGYEGVERLKKRPQLWAGSAVITPATDSATEPVTTLDAQRGGEQIGSASGQSGLSKEVRPNSSERRLAEQQGAVPDLLPTQESNASSADKGNAFVGEKQENNQEKPTISAKKASYDTNTGQFDGVDGYVPWLDRRRKNGEVIGVIDGQDNVDVVYEPRSGQTFFRVHVEDENAETPGAITEVLENEGHRVNMDGEYPAFMEYDTQEEATRMAQHIAEIQQRVDDVREARRIMRDAQQPTETQQRIDAARGEVNTAPTEVQKEAGNYRKGHVRVDGYDISIENPKGSVRSGVDANGQAWSVTMNNDYGYIRGTKAVDGDHIDVFLSDNPEEGSVFVVDQLNDKGEFDESKVMYGFNSREEAEKAYLANYSEGWADRVMAVTEVSKEKFKKWINSSTRKTKPFSEYKSVKQQSATTQNPSGNKLVSDERYQELLKRMRSKLGGQLNVGVDPELLAIGTEMAVYHIEKGARKFMAYAKEMISDIGDVVRPYLKAFYNGARDLPGMEEYAKEMTPYEEVSKIDVASIGKQASMLDMAEQVAREQEVKVQVEEVKKSSSRKKQSKQNPPTQGDLFGDAEESDKMQRFYVENVGDMLQLRRERVMPNGMSVADARPVVRANSAQEMLDIINNPANRFGKELDNVRKALELEIGATKTYKDNQGNPVDVRGKLVVERIGSIDELTDEDFTNPTRNVELPKLPKNVDEAIGADGRPVIIKKNIFERNRQRHSEITSNESREILKSALYNPDLYGQNQKAKRPYNWVVINTKDESGRNRLVLLEVNNNKDNVEIVHWHYIDNRGLEKIKRQAEHEDGQLLILPSEVSEEVGALSDPMPSLSSESKGTQSDANMQASGKENDGEDVSLQGRTDEQGVTKRTVQMVDFSDEVKRRMLDALEKGEKPFRSIVELRKLARECGMEVSNEGRTDILIQELVEDGLVKAGRKLAEKARTKAVFSRGKSFFPVELYEQICRLYEMQPTIGQRSSNRIRMQQYSTPLPMAFVADMFVDEKGKITGDEQILEPAAGNGMLVFAVPAGKVHVNELDDVRYENLRFGGYHMATKQDATQPFEGGRKYKGVLSNPPFGKAEPKLYDGTDIASLEAQIALNALESMKDDGCAAIIVGGNMEYQPNGAIKGADRAFYTYLYDHYNVKGVVDMDGGLYRKQGTTYPTRMILIEGRRSDEERAQETVYPPVRDKAIPKAQSFEELYDIVNGLLNSKEKTNGTAVLRREQGLGPDSESRPGKGNDRPNHQQPQKNDREPGRGGRGGAQLSGGESQGGESVLGERGRDSLASGTGRGSDEAGRGDERNAGGGVPAQDDKRVGDGTPGQRGVGLNPVERKRSLTDEKSAYRPHSRAFSLESVAPAAMTDAMDDALRRIEAEVGDIDTFAQTELGYDSVEALHNALAAEQVDSVAMAIYQMMHGEAMIIGDQTGVGKGRQMAALIRWAVKNGKKPVFITQKADLFSDLYRDLVDIGSGDLRPFIFNQDGDIKDAKNQTVFKPLSSDKMKKVLRGDKLPDGYDFVVLTYSQLNKGDSQSKLEAYEQAKKSGKRVQKKMGEETNAPSPKPDFLRKLAKGNILLLDESHTAAGDGNTGMYLQSIMRDAEAATFASATFAKRPDTMPLYAIRTAMSKANVEAGKLIEIIEKGGVTLQEIMSRALSAVGQMVRRERDMSDVKTDWKTVDDAKTVERARSNYDRTVKAFNAIIKFQDDYVKPYIEELSAQMATQMKSAEQRKGTKDLGLTNVPFASKAYNYTKQLLLALKVDAIVDEVEREIKAGRHPVIALESTMESVLDGYNTGDVLENATFGASLMKGLENTLSYTVKDSKNKEEKHKIPLSMLPESARQAYEEVKRLIQESTRDVYVSPIDDIISKLNARGYSVGELTGRDKYVSMEDGKAVVRKRADKDKKRMTMDFNAGRTDVLILNKSASTGISLHASIRFSDQRQRTMVMAQPLSDINDYMQMIGRIDRTGQVHRGYYINLGLPVPAENRFMMMLSTKLKSLNANTTTSQDSKQNDVEAPDLLNKYGSQVVIEYLRDHPDVYEKMGDPLNLKEEKTLEDYVPQEDDARKVTGYVALLSVDEQEAFYNEVVERYNTLITQLNETDSNDLKISVMPLRAKTLSKRVATHGVDPSGMNPFAKDSYVEEVEMDVLRKPWKIAEVKKQFDALQRGMKPSERARQLLDQLVEEAKQRKEAENARHEAALAGLEKEVEVRTDKIRNQKKLSEEEKQKAIDEERQKLLLKMSSVHEKNLKVIDDQMSKMRSALTRFGAGSPYLIPDVLGTEVFSCSSPGMLIGFKVKDEGMTPSTSFAVFAVLDGRRKVEVKLSDTGALDCIYRHTMQNYDRASGLTADNWDSQIPQTTRTKGFILTGNIIQAVSDSQGREGGFAGKLVSYTDERGDIQDGILMPQAWTPSLMKSAGVPINARLSQLQETRRLESVDGSVVVEKERWGDGYTLSVPKTKKQGGKYFENEDLLGLVVGRNFNPYRGKLRADIRGERIEQVLDVLSKLGVRVDDASKDGGVKMQRAMGGSVAADLTQETELRDALVERLRGAGIEVVTDAEVGQRVLDEEGIVSDAVRMSKKRALDTVSVTSEKAHQPTVVSSADGANTGAATIAGTGTANPATGTPGLKDAANIADNLESVANSYEKSSNRTRGFITDLSRALGLRQHGASNYGSFILPDGSVLALRVSNHNAKVSNFDANDELNGLSIVISKHPNKGLVNDGAAHVTEYFYSKRDLEASTGKPLAEIARSIKSALATGEFTDTTGLAERQEVNGSDVRYFRSGGGEVYGFVRGGRVYLDPKKVNAETPIHEYAHLWADALRKRNPEEWRNVVELMKDSPVWDEVKSYYPELETDDELAEEVLAMYSGRRGAERLREMQREATEAHGKSVMEKVDAVAALERVKDALKRFWKNVAEFFNIHYTSAEEVADRVLYDLLDGVNPIGESLEEVNRRFNEELDSQINGTLGGGHIYQLGLPSSILKSTGIPDLPIQMSATRLEDKATKYGHDFSLGEVKNLVKALQEPIAVFAYGNKDKAQNIIVEIQKDGKNFVVGLSIRPTVNGRVLDINSIRNVFPKNNAEWLNWISQGKSLYLNKEKIQTLIDQQRTILADVDYLDLDSIAKIVKEFENPSVDGEKMREGEGEYDDAALSYENDPLSKWMGVSRYSTRQQKAYAEKVRRQMREQVMQMAKAMGIDIDIVESGIGLSGRKARAKGWFSPRTGRVTVVIGNHSGVQDVMKTVLHESVAHYGLRRLFKQHFDDFLDNVFANASFDVRHKIMQLAGKHGYNVRTATEEYLAGLAEETDFQSENSWFGKIQHFFLRMLAKAGVMLNIRLTDNELKYILWRSYQNLVNPGRYRDVVEDVKDVAMQASLGADLYRDGGPSVDDLHKWAALDAYERSMEGFSYKMQEAFQDCMFGLKKLQDALANASGKPVKDYENAYRFENSLSSTNDREIEAFERLFFGPMVSAVHALTKEGVPEQAVYDYLMAKHGIERNREMAVMKALRSDADTYEAFMTHWRNEKKQIVQDGSLSWEEEQQRLDELALTFGADLSQDYSGFRDMFPDSDEYEEKKQKAIRMVVDFENAHSSAASSLWQRIGEANRAVLTKQRESGLMSREQFERVSEMYQYYVPLRGFDETVSDEVYDYIGGDKNRFSAPQHRAKGRASKADNPIAYIGHMSSCGIVQGNKNLMKQKLLMLVKSRPSDLVSSGDLWARYDASTDEWVAVFPETKPDDSPAVVQQKLEDFEENMTQAAVQHPDLYAKVKERPSMRYRVLGDKLSEHQIIVKVSGKPVVLTILGNPRAAQAVNGLMNPVSKEGFFGLLERANRFMAANFTKNNPAFVVANLVRDGIYSNSMVWVKESPKYAMAYHTNWLKSEKEIYGLVMRYKKGALDMNNPTDKMFHDFIMHGGETGYNFLGGVDDYKKRIRRKMKQLDGSKLSQSLEVVREGIDTFNRFAEDVSRFAAYRTSIEQGRSVSRAIEDAKEISVNFNRRGAGAKSGGVVGALAQFCRGGYIFFNAGVQGMYNFVRSARRHPGKFGALCGSLMCLGALMPMLSVSLGMLFGSNDDDYWDIPEYTRRNNLCLLIGGGKYVCIPLPIELRALYGIGEMAASVLAGRESFDGMKLSRQVSQIFPVDPLEGNDNFLSNLAPSYAKPVIEALGNKSWTGVPIYKDTPFNKQLPEWTKAYKGTSPYLVSLSEALNSATGGNKYKKGWMDVNPAVVEHLIQGYAGGVGTTINQSIKSLMLLSGNGDVDGVNQVPVLNRFLKEGSDRTKRSALNNRYFEMEGRYKEVKRLYNSYSKELYNEDASERAKYSGLLDELSKKKEFVYMESFFDAKKSLDRVVDYYKESGDEAAESMAYELKQEMLDAFGEE